MNGVLQGLAAQLRVRLHEPLPGSDAHGEMRAVPDEVARARFPHQAPPRPGSVLILLYETESGVRFPLIRRSESGGAHSGQISLPGGKNEPHESSESAALRETHEEIGVHPENIRVIGALSPFHVIPSNFLVQPIVGLADSAVRFRPDPREVEHVIEVPLDSLINDQARGHALVEAAGNRWKAPCFRFGNHVVWGATAMILNEFRCLVRESGFSR